MKRVLSVLIVALMTLSYASAQSGLHFGVKAGLNISNVLSNEDLYDSKSKIGAHLGPMINFGLGRNGNFSILGELLFDMKGAKQEGLDEDGNKKDYPLSLTYIDVPVMARYRFNFGLFLETGPYFGFLMGASFDGDSEYDSFDSNGDPIKVKVKDSFKGSDLGWAWGLGYIAEAGWGVGYRGNLGLSDIGEDPEGYSGVGFITLNTCTQISFLYYLNWED